MRRLGAELGVEAMSLYKHVANKEEILDGVVELVVGEIAIPGEGSHWKDAMRQRAISAREVLASHSWAIGLLETRGSMGPAAMRYLDAILGNLRSAGFTIENAVHAFWLLDSYVYGHVIQETTLSRGARSPPRTESAAAVRSRPRRPSTRIWPRWPNTRWGPTTASTGSSSTASTSSSTPWSRPRPRRLAEPEARRTGGPGGTSRLTHVPPNHGILLSAATSARSPTARATRQ